MLANINTMFEAEQIGHLPLRTLAETHDHLLLVQEKSRRKKTQTFNEIINSYTALSIIPYSAIYLCIYLSIHFLIQHLKSIIIMFKGSREDLIALSILNCNPIPQHVTMSKQENGCKVIREVLNKFLLSSDPNVTLTW